MGAVTAAGSATGDDLAQRTRSTYARHAQGYDAKRSRALFEARWLARFAAAVGPRAHLLDLGCGSGRPIAEWLIGEGFAVTGADFAAPMLDLARARWPEGDWRLCDMRNLDLGERFDGIICWDSFFHLTPGEQRACLPLLAAHLAPGGVLMLTVGPKAGEVVGQVEGDPVYHASLSPAGYALALEECGMRMTGFMAEDPECDSHSVLMAVRDGA